MKTNPLPAVFALCLFATSATPAAVRYVDLNSANPAPPYTDWATAATNIQDAVDAAVAGDEVVVTNGIYQAGGKSIAFQNNRVAVDKPLTLRSVNGPRFTTIEGAPGRRCVYLANGTFLAGFTLTNGSLFNRYNGYGGGVVFGDDPSDGVVSNCVIVGCGAVSGGGASSAQSFAVPPTVSGGTLIDCTLTNNQASGLAAFPIQPAFGGAVTGCRLINCRLDGNVHNIPSPGAVVGAGAYASILQNCLLVGNSVGQGAGGGAANSALINCTVAGNTASAGAGTYACWLTNCIVSDNNGTNHDADNFVAYTCTTPLADGPGNITNAPLFVDAATGNSRLQAGSPCINAGNNNFVTSPVDLTGWERIVGGTVDMGAYEWIDVPTHYVSLTSPNPTPPYLSWSTAATNIQDAVNAASFRDRVLVTNGIYQTGATFRHSTIAPAGAGYTRVDVRKSVSVESVNGPAVTSIVGYQVPGTTNGATAVRCVYLSDFAVLSGFTLTSGATLDYEAGGGVYCESTYATVSNCFLIGNAAGYGGGGSFDGTLQNCTLKWNSAPGPMSDLGGGGGALNGSLTDCVLTENYAKRGGGAAADSKGVSTGSYWCWLTRCILTGNRADYGGGTLLSELLSCTFSGNSARYGGGAYGGILRNCLLTGNTATAEGGGAYGGKGAGVELFNCTLAGNFASIIGGGTACGVTTFGFGYGVYLNDCIVYDNAIGDTSRNHQFGNYAIPGLSPWSFRVIYSCTTPLPPKGEGNITNAPLFVDTNGWANLRLQSNSPCINAGENSYDIAETDLDDLPRIVGGTVDMGAYEFQSPSSVLSYAWAQQYGLPTDGSADFTDADSDLMNNWQEWIAGTVPTDAASALRLLNPIPGPTGAIVTWQSVTNRIYFLERSTNLGAQPAFSPLGAAAGQSGTTSFTDTNATGPGPFFYRVGVQR